MQYFLSIWMVFTITTSSSCWAISCQQSLSVIGLVPVLKYDTSTEGYDLFPLNTAREAYAEGQAQAAIQYLLDALAHNKHTKELSDENKLEIHNTLADWLIAQQQLKEAYEQLEAAWLLAVKHAEHLAAVLNHFGNWHLATEAFDTADQNYQQAERLAVDDLLLTLKIRLNRLRLAIREQDGEQASVLFQRLSETADELSLSQQQSLIELGLGLQALAPEFERASWLQQRLMQLQQQLDEAKAASFDDVALINGYLGHLYEQQQQFEQALHFTRKAIFFSQGFPEQAYRWQWQLGRLFQQLAQPQTAIKAYEQATQTLNPLVASFLNGQRDPLSFFQTSIRPVYMGLVELYLMQAAEAVTFEQEQNWLRKAQQVLESRQSAELVTYFQDECMSLATRPELPSTIPPAHSAFLYPIVLPERLVLLTQQGHRYAQVSVEVSSAELIEAARQFHLSLREVSSYRDLELAEITQDYAQPLYEWLIAPIQPQLTEIETLVIIPDIALSLVPFSALHNGEQYLMEFQAITIVPSILLASPANHTQPQNLLVNGLSEAVQGFSALEVVKDEIQALEQLYVKSEHLLEEAFSYQALKNRLSISEAEIVHIASHAKFESQFANTFILTYHDKITMPRLRNLLAINQFREQPIDLLFLGACQTAQGNARAAFGLAGVGLHSGAKSVIGTLWLVDDFASAQLSTAFHQFLQQGDAKSVALQKAQQAVFKKQADPYYWAAHTLIGY